MERENEGKERIKIWWFWKVSEKGYTFNWIVFDTLLIFKL